MRKKVMAGLIVLAVLISGCAKTENSKSADQSESGQTKTQSSHAETSTVKLTEGKYSEEDLDAAYDESNAGKITFGDDGASAEGAGAETKGNNVTISEAGTYIVTGTVQDGSIFVELKEKGEVRLILDNASITCKNGPAIQGNQGKITITLAEGTKNYLADGENYEAGRAEKAEAAVFSKDDLTFNGNGSLEIKADYKNAVQSKDDLKFISGDYTINAEKCGIVGKDSVTFRDGTYKITSGNDGIRAANAAESDQGYLIVDGGSFHIDAGADAMQAETLLLVNGGDFQLTSGGGVQNAETKSNSADGFKGEGPEGDFRSEMAPPDGEKPSDMPPLDEVGPSEGGEGQEENQAGQETQQNGQAKMEVSTKALKSYVDIQIKGGTFDINACDDAIHSNHSVTVDGGTLKIQTGDDGIHADQNLVINNGTIQITQSYEGLEGLNIAVNNGNISITASDDGINAAGGSDTALDSEPEKEEGESGGRNREKGMEKPQEKSQGAVLTINGGSVTVDASGDGLDANGSIVMTDGAVTVQGPQSSGDGTFDYVDGFSISGGTLLAAGSSGMVQAPDDSSEQPVITWTQNSGIKEGTEITVTDSAGSIILNMAPTKEVQWICLSDPDLKKGETYTVTAGDEKKTVKLDNMINQITE